MAVLSPDVLIFESGGAERSRAEYASHHMKSDMAFLAQMGHDQISQAASEQGDAAWIVTESRIYGRYKDKDIDIVSTETAVLERGEDGWKIVHLHWSSR
jgi:ketosteroid isomerase-like protein